MAATTGSTKGRRFAAACGVLSRCVKAAAEDRPAPTAALPLMPGGAEVAVEDEHVPAVAAHAQMTIFYGGRVLVLEEVPADRAAELLRVAAAAGATPRASGETEAADRDLPMARKASLQRFMEKRKGRRAARCVPYSRRPDGDALTIAL